MIIRTFSSLERSQARWRGSEDPLGLTWGIRLSGKEFFETVARTLGAKPKLGRVVEIGPGAGRLLMARVFVTGSSDGLGLLAGKLLIDQGHAVTLHARNAERAEVARRAAPQASAVVVGDVGSIAEMRRVAEQVNALGRHDAVIHNVGVGAHDPRRIETADGLTLIFAVNVLAPYLLTALISRPDRLIYLTSGMHHTGTPDLDDPQWTKRNWNGLQAYSNSKLYDVMLAFALARHWPNVTSNAMEPGWVPTKLGGPEAPDNLELGAATQVWLAVSDDRAASVSGQNFFHQQQVPTHKDARRTDLQDQLLSYCAQLTGARLPD
jgi:NAD(P)-dependent dehydrogenase (short-subunit alcohol dehydrogenase family)